MAKHSVAEAKNHLPDLIDRALGGEEVIITRHGHPVVELRRISRLPRPVEAKEIDWLAQRRVGRRPFKHDAGTLISNLRDEDG